MTASSAAFAAATSTAFVSSSFTSSTTTSTTSSSAAALSSSASPTSAVSCAATGTTPFSSSMKDDGNEAASIGGGGGGDDDASTPPSTPATAAAAVGGCSKRLAFDDDEKVVDDEDAAADRRHSHCRYYPVDEIRSQILLLGELAGNLSGLFRRLVPLDPPPCDAQGTKASAPSSSSKGPASSRSKLLHLATSKLLSALLATSGLLDIDLKMAVLRKMELNRRKYPADLCRGKAGKYTEYSDATGITRDRGQSTIELLPAGSDGDENGAAGAAGGRSNNSNDEFEREIPVLTRKIRAFAAERNWEKYHKPRSLMLALLGELGELAELFQFKEDRPQPLYDGKGERGKDDEDDGQRAALDKVGQEIADVTIYLMRLADVCGVEMSIVSVGDDEGEDEGE